MCQTKILFLNGGGVAYTKICQNMRFRDAVGSADLKTFDFTFPKDAIAGFDADTENFAHLLDAHHVGIVLKYEFVRVPL